MTTTRPALVIFVLIIALLLLLAVALITVGLVANYRARQLGPEHPGATISTPTLSPAEAPTRIMPIPHPFPAFQPATPPRPVGRHHEDTVRPVPADWMPVTGGSRIRALEETRQFPRPDLAPWRKESGS